MRLLVLGILLVVVGIVLNFTGLLPLGGPITYLGWVCVALGVILAIVHFVMGPRRTVVERRREIL